MTILVHTIVKHPDSNNKLDEGKHIRNNSHTKHKYTNETTTNDNLNKTSVNPLVTMSCNKESVGENDKVSKENY